MTVKAFFNKIQFRANMLLDDLDYEIDFLLHAADEYGFDKTELMYFIVDYKEKHQKRKKYYLRHKETGLIYKDKQDFILKNDIERNLGYRTLKDNDFEQVDANELVKLGIDFF